MATSLFHVTVLSVEGTRARLALRIITGEQPDFYAGPSFALMLLYDPIAFEMVQGAPLERQFTRDDMMDPEWVDEHVDEYIESVRLFDVRKLPGLAGLGDMAPADRAAFFRSDRAPTATFEVTTTNPAWLTHLTEGMEWESSAYDALL